MSSLNLHLDFMNEPEKPIRYIELSAEEELQIMEDSNKLLRQIDEDCRVLDGMCSALENLFIIKRHYDEFGSSPALEALVGDIHEYLGISIEADEAKTEGAEGEKKGGIGGAISKVIDWIVGLFRRIGEWLNLVDKKVDADQNNVKAELQNAKKLSSVYMCKFLKGLYANGTVNQPPACKDIEDALKRAITACGFGGNEYKGAVEIDNIVKKFQPYTELGEQEIKGSDIKLLNDATYKLYKGTRGIVKTISPMLDELKKNMDANKAKNSEKTDQSYMDNPIEQLNAVIKKSVPIIKLVSHRAGVSIASMANVLRGKTKGRTEEEVNKEKQDRAAAAEQAKPKGRGKAARSFHRYCLPEPNRR